MKKLLAVILVICLAFAAFVGTVSGARGGLSAVRTADSAPQPTPASGLEVLELPEETEEPEAAEEAEEPAEEPVEEAGETELPSLDYEAIYALHAPEEPVFTLGSTTVDWATYFYMLYSQAQSVASYFESMAAYYGLEQSWEDEYAEGVSFADMVLTATEDTLASLCSIEGYAAENGLSLSEEAQAQVDAQIQADITSICGEGATEEDFAAYLKDLYLTPEIYRLVYETNALYQQGYIQLYGDAGEKYDEAAALAWMQDAGYLSAGHILLMSIDPATGEALDEETQAQKREQAQAIAEELQAIEDRDQLLARFKELKEEYCEDTGKTAYPDGYTFTPGTMVAEFEDAVNALADYQVSDVVETDYGYHVILRLPLSEDAVIEYSSDGQMPLTARSMASSEEYAALVQAYADDHELTYAEGFEPIDLLDYVRK